MERERVWFSLPDPPKRARRASVRQKAWVVLAWVVELVERAILAVSDGAGQWCVEGWAAVTEDVPECDEECSECDGYKALCQA